LCGLRNCALKRDPTTSSPVKENPCRGLSLLRRRIRAITSRRMAPEFLLQKIRPCRIQPFSCNSSQPFLRQNNNRGTLAQRELSCCVPTFPRTGLHGAPDPRSCRLSSRIWTDSLGQLTSHGLATGLGTWISRQHGSTIQ
jgi:hypothetical protein